MKHVAKNQTDNKTYQWKNERQRQMDYYNSCPFVGNQVAELFYNTMKKAIPSIIHASVCGVIIAVVTYKQDADKAAHLLSASFKKKIRQSVCPYTDFVTTSLLNH